MLEKFILAPLPFFAVGLSQSTGFLEYPFMYGYDTNHTPFQIAAIISTQYAIFQGSQVFTAIVYSYTNSQLLRHLWLFFGVICWTSGMIGTAFSNNYDQLIGIFGTLNGLGGSILLWGPLADRMGDRWGTLILLAAGTAGELFHYALISTFLHLNQWRFTLILLGSISAGIMTISIIISMIFTKPVNKKTFKNNTYSLSNTKLILLIVATLFTSIVNMAPYMNFVEFLIFERFITLEKTSLVMILFSLGGFIGRLLPLMLLHVYSNPHYFLLLSSLVALLVPSAWFLIYDFPGAAAFAAFAGFMGNIQSSFLFATIGDENNNYFRITPFSVISFTLGSFASGVLYTEMYEYAGLLVTLGLLVASQGIGFLLTLVSYIV